MFGDQISIALPDMANAERVERPGKLDIAAGVNGGKQVLRAGIAPPFPR